MADAQKIIESQIKNAYGGNFEKDGITFSVDVSVTATVYSSEKAAIESGAMNVVQITAGDALPGVASSFVDPRRTSNEYDTGAWSIKDILRPDGSIPAHEFVHLLGVPNQNKPNSLANGYDDQRAAYATYDDYHWIFDGPIDRHRSQSRLPNPVPLAIMNKAPAANGFGAPRNHLSKQTLRASRRF
jgi:hypothetical protein